MLSRWQFTTLTVLSTLTLALVVVDIVLYSGNRSAQAEVAARAQYLQQTVQLQSLYQEIVKALAELSMRNQDGALRELLAKQGISLAPPPMTFPVPAAPPPRK